MFLLLSIILIGTFGKIAVTSPRSREIASLALQETTSDGSTRLLPLTTRSSCSTIKAFFTDDYYFNPGTICFQLEGVDINGVHFTPDFDNTVVIPRPYHELKPTDTTVMSMEYRGHFTMEFELFSNNSIGTANFTLSVEASGFIISLAPSANIRLQPKQVLIVFLVAPLTLSV